MLVDLTYGKLLRHTDHQPEWMVSQRISHNNRTRTGPLRPSRLMNGLRIIIMVSNSSRHPTMRLLSCHIYGMCNFAKVAAGKDDIAIITTLRR